MRASSDYPRQDGNDPHLRIVVDDDKSITVAMDGKTKKLDAARSEELARLLARTVL